MAEKGRMTAGQVVDKVMGSEHVDVVRESVAWLVAELMDAEVAAQIGAELGEVSSERVTHRNGYRARPWQTRAGEIELAIPRLRQGSYFPSFLEPRKRSQQALIAVVQDAYLNGVSTRRSTASSSGWRRRDRQGRRLAALPWPRRACAGVPRAPAGEPLPLRVAEGKIERSESG